MVVGNGPVYDTTASAGPTLPGRGLAGQIQPVSTAGNLRNRACVAGHGGLPKIRSR